MFERLVPVALVLTPAVATTGLWPSQSYVTEAFLPPDMKVVQTAPTAPGYLFLSPNGNGTTAQSPLIFNNDNQLIWSGPAEGWSYTDFHVQQVEDAPYLTYWRGNASATFGHGYGSVHFLDQTYSESFSFCLGDESIVTPGNVTYECYLDQHEALVTSEGTLLATAYNVTQIDLSPAGGPKDGWIFDSMFYEIDIATGEVVFEWHSLEHQSDIPIAESRYPLHNKGTTVGSDGSDPWDYFHINSVERITDGYLVNGRHFFSTFKILFDGSVEWQFAGDNGGDFQLADDIYFSWQHNPRTLPGYDRQGMSLTYFNNDNSEIQNGTNSTTALIINLDLMTMLATLYRTLVSEEELLFADSQGSYQSLENDHALIGYGQIAKTREFNKDGNIIFEATYGYSNASSMCASYRSYRFEWEATPVAPPKAVVKQGKLYVSWNGATNIDRWMLHAGKSCSSLKPLGPVEKRAGFETSFDLRHIKDDYAVAEALNRDGTSLGQSDCLKVGWK